MIPENKLARLVDRFQAIEAELASGTAGSSFVKLSKEHAELAPVIAVADQYRSTARQITDAEALIEALRCPEEGIHNMLAYLEEFGGARAYLEAIGMSCAHIERLRSRLRD